MQFTVLIVSPADYPHSECFREVADTICDGLRQLGHEAAVDTRVRPGTKHIVLGAHLAEYAKLELPDNCTIYNLEQLPGNPSLRFPAYYDLLRRHTVWDYAEDNVREFARFDIRVEAILPISYYSGLTKINQSASKDIDVLFIGSINRRRKDVLEQMESIGLNVVSLFNKYGAERDAFIARSKVLLNIHIYPAKILEQVRISYYLANGTAVVSEFSGDPAVDEEWKQGVLFAPYEELVIAAKQLCDDDSARNELAGRGFQFIVQRDIKPALAAALAAPASPPRQN